EALMQDGKALQAGTSHFLGQNFAKAFDVKFLNKENQQDYVWATSWGASTRLIGALVMAHGDDDGLILPPKIAPLQVVIVPISSKDASAQAKISETARRLLKELKAAGISARYDDDDNSRPGWKFAEYEMKGVPVRIALGARDLQNNVAEVVRRDTKEKQSISLDALTDRVIKLLDEIQQYMFNKARSFRDEHTTQVDGWDEFEKTLDEKGGFISAHWDGTAETEEAIKEKTKATIRCIPLDAPNENGK
ncbi:MAG TPA: His/Gly/Thr/Pro-type tRNA ligase C-terminal domain-containing protein, partial [Chitinophagaceae bacterium]|nr:His/Gly/Thr/Pro-type tRNA ligase C-terminal domain-containing protein [Chitinophagaceae bacterium]